MYIVGTKLNFRARKVHSIYNKLLILTDISVYQLLR